MPSSNSAIQFKYGLQTNYTALSTKDVNTVYFCTDTQRMFVGETEYTRPVAQGTTLPTAFLPPNSFFYKTDTQALYFSEDGTKWTACSNFYTHPSFTARTLGSQTAATLGFGGTFKVPSITVNNQGHVTAGEDITFTLPAAPADVKNTVSTTGSGNAVTSVAIDSSGHAFTFTKGTRFATYTELSEAIGQITSFSVDAGPDGTGYESVDDLPATGENGVFYLVVSAKTSTGNEYAEYFWTGTAYEKAGQFGDVDLSGYVPTSRTVNGKALSANITLTKSDIGLGNVDNTADADKSVKSAATLTTARTIALSGAVTGTATSFNGSANITIPTTSVDGTKVTGKVPSAAAADTATSATSATKATQDGSGNVITSTYATKTELTNASLKWGSF